MLVVHVKLYLEMTFRGSGERDAVHGDDDKKKLPVYMMLYLVMTMYGYSMEPILCPFLCQWRSKSVTLSDDTLQTRCSI